MAAWIVHTGTDRWQHDGQWRHRRLMSQLTFLRIRGIDICDCKKSKGLWFVCNAQRWKSFQPFSGLCVLTDITGDGVVFIDDVTREDHGWRLRMIVVPSKGRGGVQMSWKSEQPFLRDVTERTVWMSAHKLQHDLFGWKTWEVDGLTYRMFS